MQLLIYPWNNNYYFGRFGQLRQILNQLETSKTIVMLNSIKILLYQSNTVVAVMI